jgi:hypothetical protein
MGIDYALSLLARHTGAATMGVLGVATTGATAPPPPPPPAPPCAGCAMAIEAKRAMAVMKKRMVINGCFEILIWVKTVDDEESDC